MLDTGLGPNRFEPPNGDGKFVDKVRRNRFVGGNVCDGFGLALPESHPPIHEANLVHNTGHSAVDSMALLIGETNRKRHPTGRAEALGLALTVDASGQNPRSVPEQRCFLKAFFLGERSHVDSERLEELLGVGVEYLHPSLAKVRCRLSQSHRCQTSRMR